MGNSLDLTLAELKWQTESRQMIFDDIEYRKKCHEKYIQHRTRVLQQADAQILKSIKKLEQLAKQESKKMKKNGNVQKNDQAKERLDEIEHILASLKNLKMPA